MDTKEIVAALEADGYALTYVCVDAGSYKEPSKWSASLSRHGKAYTTEYTKGAGHRKWKKDPFARPQSLDYRPGQRVSYPYGRLTLAMESDLLKLTEPEPPTLDEVMYSLVSDVGSVRHGQSFEDWADYGYDTDSRKAEAIYRGCTETWRGLVRLGADFDKLEEMFQDY